MSECQNRQLISDSEVSRYMVGRTIESIIRYESENEVDIKCAGFLFTDKSEITFTATSLDESRMFGVVYDEIVYVADTVSVLSPIASVEFAINELHPVYKGDMLSLVVVTTLSGVVLHIPFVHTDEKAKLICYLTPPALIN